jgi:S1/P1 Nuclease
LGLEGWTAQEENAGAQEKGTTQHLCFHEVLLLLIAPSFVRSQILLRIVLSAFRLHPGDESEVRRKVPGREAAYRFGLELSYSEFVEFIDHPTLEEIKTWQGSTYVDWVRESQDLRDRVYRIGDGKLSYKYVFENIPTVKRRLLQAGVRLAGLLNSIFASSAPSFPDRELESVNP